MRLTSTTMAILIGAAALIAQQAGSCRAHVEGAASTRWSSSRAPHACRTFRFLRATRRCSTFTTTPCCMCPSARRARGQQLLGQEWTGGGPSGAGYHPATRCGSARRSWPCLQHHHLRGKTDHSPRQQFWRRPLSAHRHWQPESRFRRRCRRSLRTLDQPGKCSTRLLSCLSRVARGRSLERRRTRTHGPRRRPANSWATHHQRIGERDDS